MSDEAFRDPFLPAFGSHLRSLRSKAGLSQEEVAGRAGIHVTYLSGVERGLRNPSLINIKRLAHALGVPTKELFSFDEPLAPEIRRSGRPKEK